MGDKVNNLKGEQGGVYLEDGESFSASDVADYACGFLCITATELASITQAKFGGTESKLVGVELVAGSYIPGQISAMEVTTGLVQLQYHDN